MTSPLSKLGLGSAQFGLDQTALVRGRAPQAEARDILDIAARAQLTLLDVDGHSAAAEMALGEVMPRPHPFNVSISTVRPDRGPDYVEAEAQLDPDFPERLKAGFLEEYYARRKEGHKGDELFELMCAFAQRGLRRQADKTAGIAVLIYLFEICDVFEK